MINYDKRACWDEFVSEDSELIKTIIQRLRAKTLLEIPCANGRNLELITDRVKYAIFADLNAKMIDSVKNKIKQKRLANCSARIMDLCDLSSLKGVDLIIIPQQSIQLLDQSQIKKALHNMRASSASFIMIDIYDFLCNASDLPKYLVEDITFLDEYGSTCVRHSTISVKPPNVINLSHSYFVGDNRYTTDVLLYNYSRDVFSAMCVAAGFIINEVFTSYDMACNKEHGRTIFLLRNPHEK